VVAANTTVGVVQELKADRAITALSALTAPEARVLRDGVQQVVAAVEVVVDEAALTGESVPVDKAAPDGRGRPGDPVSSGTVVVCGRGRATVTATGAASATGRVVALMVTGARLTPLQRRLAGVGRALAGVAVVLCAAVMTLGLVRGLPVELMVLTAVSLVVASVPESLPAVETLGSVTALATDKTGTLTAGSMAVTRLWTPDRDTAVDGAGYAPTGRIPDADRVLVPDAAPDVTDLLSRYRCGFGSGNGGLDRILVKVIGTIVWGKAGKDTTTLDAFYTDLGDIPAKALHAVSMDLGPAFTLVFRSYAAAAVQASS